MAGNEKRARQREGREARRAAAEAARKKAARRRSALIFVVMAIVVGGVIWLVSSGGDDTEVTSGTSSTAPNQSTVPAAQSAAGKPCVAVADALPTGAPQVPVKTGPPPTSLIKEDLRVGTGAEVTPGATVTVNYIGVACSTGKIFDSSYSRSQSATFPLGQVIEGWRDGIPGMKVGGQRLLGIPAAQAYGSAGRPPNIAPDEPLWFVVEVVDTPAS